MFQMILLRCLIFSVPKEESISGNYCVISTIYGFRWRIETLAELTRGYEMDEINFCNTESSPQHIKGAAK